MPHDRSRSPLPWRRAAPGLLAAALMAAALPASASATVGDVRMVGSSPSVLLQYSSSFNHNNQLSLSNPGAGDVVTVTDTARPVGAGSAGIFGGDGCPAGHGTATVTCVGSGRPHANISVGDDRVDLTRFCGAFAQAGTFLPGAAHISGGNGNDTLIGTVGARRVPGCARADDTIDGGPGNDFMSGFDGPDMLDGGPGLDTLNGGPGADRLVGREDPGETAVRDRLACGRGTVGSALGISPNDTAVMDLQDVTAGCPIRQIAAIDEGGILSIASKSLRTRGGRVAVRLRCPRDSKTRCNGRLSIRKGRRTLGSARYRIRKGGRTTVRVRVSRRRRGTVLVRARERDSKDRPKTSEAQLRLR